MFALELESRSIASRWGFSGMAAHPGVARTDLVHNTLGRRSWEGLARTLFSFLLQPAWQGALPSLYAATSPQAAGGGYYGPDKLREMRGYPRPARIPAQALDPAARKKLWEMSESMTGMAF